MRTPPTGSPPSCATRCRAVPARRRRALRHRQHRREHLPGRRRVGRGAAQARRRRDVRRQGRRPRRLPALPPRATATPPRARRWRRACATPLERDELELHYQPLVDLRDRRIVGAEALIRWNDPDAACSPPAEFLPIAERTGLIRPITDWVVDEACRQSRDWRDAGHDLFVSGQPAAGVLAADGDAPGDVHHRRVRPERRPDDDGDHRDGVMARSPTSSRAGRAARAAACGSRSTTSASATRRSAVSTSCR